MSATNVKLATRKVDALHLTHPPKLYRGDGSFLTTGPAVGDMCGLAGFYPDPEQQELLDLLFALGPDGKSLAFEFDLIAARQNLKTGFILMAEIGWLFVTGEQLIVHSAHELDTTGEAFIDLRNLITETPAFARRLASGPSNGIYEGNGQWRIELASGPRIKYKARTKGGGRGLTGSKVVLDEGFALLPSHMGALLPTLAAVPDPQVLTASSAGKKESAVLRDKRDRGRLGSSSRQVYAEYGDPNPNVGCKLDDCQHEKAAKGCVLDDEARWAVTNPALGRRITLDTLRAMRQAMPPEEFAREFMVWWDDSEVSDNPPALDFDRWGALSDPDAKMPARVSVYVSVSPDASRTTIAAVGDGRDGRPLGVTVTRPGVAWAAKRLAKMTTKRDVAGIALNARSQAGVLVPMLKAAGVDFEKASSEEVGQACAGLLRGVEDRTFAYVSQPPLDAAAQEAHTREVGEAVVFDQRDPGAPDISPLVALAGALHRWSSEPDYDELDSIY